MTLRQRRNIQNDILETLEKLEELALAEGARLALSKEMPTEEDEYFCPLYSENENEARLFVQRTTIQTLLSILVHDE